jgi:hypothetical protein
MRLKPLYFLFTLLMLVIGAGVITNKRYNYKTPDYTEVSEATLSDLETYIDETYNLLNLGSRGLSKEVFRKGMLGYLNLKQSGKLNSNKSVLSVIDFSLSSKKERMWVIDLNKNKVLYQTVVAHGRNSGGDYANTFSNQPHSNMTSLGFYVTGESYIGKHGLSLRLDGMDRGFNDNARSRAIVMHGADYANPSVTATLGRLGRSLGCPAVPMSIHEQLIRVVQGGTVLFHYYPDKKYETSTGYFNIQSALAMFRTDRQFGML